MSFFDNWSRKEGISSAEANSQMDQLQNSQLGEQSEGYSPDMSALSRPSQVESLSANTQAALDKPMVTPGDMKTTQAAAMTGNPWVIAGAAAMDVYQQYENRKQQERIAEYEAKLNKIRGMQQSLGNAAQMAGRISYV